MRRLTCAAAVLALAAAAMADKKGGGSKDPEGYVWESNYEAARLKAAEAGKLLFIDFYTES